MFRCSLTRFLIIILFSARLPVIAQTSVALSSKWWCKQVGLVAENGQQLSKPNYELKQWSPAVVPGTVLTTLLANKLVPDPFFGMNNQHIPDIYNTGRDYYTYWFATDFNQNIPQPGKQVWLQLRGVNYSCDVFLNGSKLNDSTFHGMFLRQRYNITRLLNRNGSNRLAVIVYPPDPVGNPNGGQGGDGTIAKNVAHQYIAGWDWIQPIRDRNTGIWDKIFIETTGPVRIVDPHVVTIVPDVRLPGAKQLPATIKMAAELDNSTALPVSGSLQYKIGTAIISKKVQLAPHSITQVVLPNYTLNNPKLWWPNGYGRQDLYNTNIEFVEDGEKVSDRQALTFGVREIRREWNITTQSSQFLVNGQKIFIKGGNWIISDAMLRLSDQRYDAEIRFHRDMNLNLIRIWGGALLERPEFYNACDKYGMLVFQDLWMSGDCNGRWNDPLKAESKEVRRRYPDDHELFIRSAADGIRMIRNHASLAIWCGGNEITPPDDILKVLRDSLFPVLDGTRVFFDYSNSDSMSKNILRGGGDGPYNVQPTDTFWKFRTYPFNSEVGSVGLGDYESLKRFIPAQNMVPPQYTAASGTAKATTRVDSVWDYHKYIGYDQYIDQYGKAKDAQDFSLKAQLVNYDQYRALMEGFSSHMWDWYTGTIIWKTQNPWTAMRGQMYDYYLDPNACLYGLRKGGEGVHVMYDPVAGTPMVVNNGFTPISDLSIEVHAIHLNGRDTLVFKGAVTMSATSVHRFAMIKDVVDRLRAKQGVFLNFKLLSKGGKSMSDNFYWLADLNGNYTGLQQMEKTSLQVNAKRLSTGKVQVTLENPGTDVAFFNRIAIVDEVTHQRILPAFYSDNYISVLPGKRQVILVDAISIKPVMVSVEGWNVAELFIPVAR